MGESHWGTTPKRSIAAESERRGSAEVVEGCRRLLRGQAVDDDLLVALAGPAASEFLGGAERDDDYWLRVWGARGLLWQWDPCALPEVEAALGDPSWRVREMALLVVKRNGVNELRGAVASLQRDPVPRVRTAATKALLALG